AASTAARIVSSIGRPVRAQRTASPTGRSDAADLAIHFPVLSAGPGAHHTSLTAAELARYQDALTDIVGSLKNLKADLCAGVLNAIRLVQLANNNVRDDFGLAYFLLISAIEFVATDAIGRN